jgi:cell division transport system permease protein
MRAQFVLSEVGVGLRRNKTMTVATVITTAIALALLGTGVFMYRQVHHMQGYWNAKIDVAVFLQNGITPAEQNQIATTLSALPQVVHVNFVDQQQAWRQFKQEFSGEPDLIKNTSPSALPESFQVKLENPSQYNVVASAVGSDPGVSEVATESTVLKKFFRLMDGMRTAAWAAAVVGLLAALLLVWNATRVSAFSRRRETGIMRLVGASRTYIRLPFVLEGAIAGAVGAILADAALAVVKAKLVDGILVPSLKFTSFFGWGVFWSTAAGLIVLGVLAPAIASAISLRRHLAV